MTAPTHKNISLILFAMISFFSISTSAQQLENLGDLKERVENYYTSGKFTFETESIIGDAKKHFDSLQITGKQAVLFDIDETALLNYEHIKSLNFGFEQNIWNNWIKEMKATANLPVLDLYNFLIKKKIHVVFLTGRTEDDLVYTEKNLINTGFKDYDTIIVRTKSDRSTNASQFKYDKRKALTQYKGYDIIGSVGDQDSDFAFGLSGYIVKVPNYMYKIK